MTDPGLELFYNLDLNRFYKIYTTIHEMLDVRGYTPIFPFLDKQQWIGQYLGFLAEIEDECNDFNIFNIVDNMSLIFKKGNKQLLVYFYPLDSKLCQNDMNYIHNMMTEKNTQHLIIVSSNKATPKVASVIGILGHNAQLFSEDELVYNVTKHQLVPKHTCTSPEERTVILNHFAKNKNGEIRADLLPAMFSCDIIARFYNFKIDDLIRIERARSDGFFDISYRIVTTPITEKDTTN